MKRLLVILSALLVSAPALAQYGPVFGKVVVKKQQINVTANQSNQGQTVVYQVSVPRVMQYTDLEWQNTTEYGPYTEMVAGICTSYKCDNDGGGQSPAWNKFYSSPKAEKAAALAEAIKGVGVASAEKLIANGSFSSKPRSWTAFSREIEAAAQANVIDEGVKYQTLVKFRAENLVNLGYAAGSCVEYTYSCMIQEDRNGPHQVNKQVEVTRETAIDSTARNVAVTVSGSTLQSFEQDSISITVGVDPQDFQVKTTGYTNYAQQASFVNGQLALQMVGQSRILVALPAEVNRLSSVVQTGNGLSFSVQVDPKYVPAAGSNDKLVLTYVVDHCGIRFGGLCWGSYSQVDRGTVELSGSGATVALKNVAKNSKTEVRYILSRRNSPFYNANPTREFKTETFKWK